jgi:hypothetical protein
MKLAENLEVKFKYMPDSLENYAMAKAQQLSVDGLAYPAIAEKSKVEDPENPPVD